MLPFDARMLRRYPRRALGRVFLIVFFALGARGVIARAIEDAATRAEVAERRLKTHFKDWHAWETLVRARLEMGDLERAEKTLIQCSNLEPKSEKVFYILDLLRGHIAKRKGHPEEALLHWTKALSKEPESVEALEAISKVEAAQKKWRDAIDATSRLLSIENNPSIVPRRVDYYIQRANWFLRIRAWARAESDVRSANELDATHARVKELLPLLESRNQWQPLMEMLDQKLATAASESEKVAAMLQRAVFLLKHAFPMQAYEDTLLAHDLMPDRLDVQFWRGVCAWQSNQTQHIAPFQPQSKEYFDWILEDPQLRKVEELGVLNEPEKQGEHLLQLKQPYMALQKTRELDGSLAKVKALRALGEKVQARKAAHRALKLMPDSPEVLLEMAEIEFENGNLTEALSSVDLILKRNHPSTHERAIALKQKALGSRGAP